MRERRWVDWVLLAAILLFRHEDRRRGMFLDA